MPAGLLKDSQDAIKSAAIEGLTSVPTIITLVTTPLAVPAIYTEAGTLRHQSKNKFVRIDKQFW